MSVNFKCYRKIIEAVFKSETQFYNHFLPGRILDSEEFKVIDKTLENPLKTGSPANFGMTLDPVR